MSGKIVGEIHYLSQRLKLLADLERVLRLHIHRTKHIELMIADCRTQWMARCTGSDKILHPLIDGTFADAVSWALKQPDILPPEE